MTVLEFELDRDHIELNQLLKLSGICDSGGAGKALVASGAVAVDGVTELRKTCKIRAGSTVELEGVTIRVIGTRPEARWPARAQLQGIIAASGIRGVVR